MGLDLHTALEVFSKGKWTLVNDEVYQSTNTFKSNLDCLKQWFDTCDTEGTSLEDKINNETGYFYEVTFRLSEIYPKINKLFNTYMEVYNCQYTFDTLEYREAKIEETLSLLTALIELSGIVENLLKEKDINVNYSDVRVIIYGDD
jgi:hypothetical protein